MKFEEHHFFKHKNGIDCFICVDNVVQDHNGKVILYVNWMTQGIFSYWTASDRERLFIKGDQYHNWEPYEPIGKYFV